MSAMRDDWDDRIFREVFSENSYGISDDDVFDKTVLDLGAHIGSFSRLCASKGARAITAVEPDPESFAIMHQSVLAWLPYCRLWHAAVARSTTTSEIVLWRFPANTGMNTTQPAFAEFHRYRGLDGSVVVPCVDLSWLLRSPVDLLKIDCEGAELDILDSDLSLVRTIVGEMHPEVYRPSDLITLLDRRGFRVTIRPNDYFRAERT